MGLTLLRHAPLPKKYHKKYIGWSDVEIDSELFCVAKIDALLDENFSHIYSSDLKRCTQTLDKMGFKYKSDARLREVRFKDRVELKSFEEIEKFESFKSEYLESFHSWYDYVCFESYELYFQRVELFLNELDLSKNTLICAHKGSLNMILKILGKEEMELDYLDSVKLSF